MRINEEYYNVPEKIKNLEKLVTSLEKVYREELYKEIKKVVKKGEISITPLEFNESTGGRKIINHFFTFGHGWSKDEVYQIGRIYPFKKMALYRDYKDELSYNKEQISRIKNVLEKKGYKTKYMPTSNLTRMEL